MDSDCSRRTFMAASTAAGLGLTGSTGAQASHASAPGEADARPGFMVGLASYTCRKFPLDKTLEIAQRAELTQVCLKDMHLPLTSTEAQIREALDKARAAGLTLYAGGVIYMKTEEQVDLAFAYAKTAGFRLIVGVPTPPLLDRAEAKVKETGILLAIHNHGPEDKIYPTPQTILDLVRNRDARVGVCMDVGHVMRSGLDPVEATRSCGARLLDVHMADNADDKPKTKRVALGRGVLNVVKFLKALAEIGYRGALSFELEACPDDPLPELAESKGFVHGVMAGLGWR